MTAVGNYTAPLNPGTYHVLATSVADPSKSAAAVVTVIPAVSVTIAPTSNLNPNQSVQLIASVSNTSDDSLIWSVLEGTAGGTVSANGVYSAPAVPGTYHVTATSAADTKQSATAIISVMSVSIAPGAPVVNPGQNIKLVSTLDNIHTSGVDWAIQEGVSGGVISADGTYTAPATPGVYHISAASQFDATIRSSITIAVTQAEQAQVFMSKAMANNSDLFLTFVSDSTCVSWGYTTYPKVSIKRWCLFFAEDLAQKLPQYTVKYRQWNYSGPGTLFDQYDPWITLQSGTGANTLWISNASFSGATAYDFLSGRFKAAVVDTTADLVLISMGHNYTWNCPGCWPNLTLDLTESTAAALPGAGIILVGENATVAPYVHADLTGVKADTVGNVAVARGYGYINVYQAFVNSGYPLADLLLDGLHPTAPDSQVGPENGSHLWAVEVSKYFFADPLATPKQKQSSLTVSAPEIIKNGNFQDYPAGTNAPTSWELHGVGSVSKDTTNIEGSHTSSLRVSSLAAAGYIQQSLPIKDVAGQCVTATARVWVDAGQPTTSGRISLTDNISVSTNTVSTNIVFGAWRWESVTRCFDPGITQAFVKLYGDSSADGGVASFDQVSVTAGNVPTAYTP